MEFGKSILHEDAAYYQLNNATIISGILTLKPGGSLKYTFTEVDIARLTEYFRIALAPTPYTDRYVPQTLVRISVEMSTGEFYTDTLFPVEFPNGIYIQEIKLKAGEYKNFTFEIETKESISFSLWELCPEAADEDIQTVIEGVEQSLPRLLYDYNTWPLSVDSYEKTIALITYRLLDHTDLQGHFLMRYVASQACTLTLRFKDNGATELFAPLLYDLSAGRGSIEIPHAYLKRLAGIHAVTVTAQVTSGTLVVDTRGILFTIDGGYLAERMLDIGVDMRDISIRQLSQDYGPDEIWIVGIEAGEAIVRKRKYDPKATISFEPVFSVGQAKEAAIEFDGDWVLRPDSENYTLETYENPWIFWIDKDSNLLAQLGSDETTRIVLDAEVTSLYACRGYKSQKYVEQDQGLICAYIKNEKAYYVQYKYNAAAKAYVWHEAEELDSSLIGVTHISIGRLNDYRIQITAKYSAGIKTYISARTYVNQAILPEQFYAPNMSRQAFSYHPNGYNTSVGIVNFSTSDDLLTLYFTVNRILEFMVYDVKDVLTFNGSIPEYNSDTGEPYVNRIETNIDYTLKHTMFTIYLNFRPKQLITEVYLNAAQGMDVLVKLDEYGYIVCPKITVQYDITRTLALPKQYESVDNVVKGISKSISYRFMKTLHTSYSEVINSNDEIKSISANIQSKERKTKNSSFTEEFGTPSISSCSITYSKINDQPI